MGGVGGFVGPTFIGYLVEDNDADDYDAAMLAVGICVMCGAALMLGKCCLTTMQFNVAKFLQCGLLLVSCHLQVLQCLTSTLLQSCCCSN